MTTLKYGQGQGPPAPKKFAGEPLSDKLPISDEKVEYLRKFLAAKLGHVDEATLENALIVLGDGDTISKRGVGPSSFSNLLADSKHYYAVVHGYYDPGTGILAYFSGRRPDDERLRHVKFVVDLDRSIMGERIIRVDSHDGPVAPSFKALEGMQVSGGFGRIKAQDLNPET
jgi:hypothetical protein